MVARNPPMIHIVHVLTRTNVGGPSVMLVDLLEGLDGNRFRQTVVRGASIMSEGDYLASHPISAEVITLRDLQRSIGVFREVRSLIELTRILRRLQPDIVHTHMAKAGVVGRLAALFARVPVRVHTFHGHLLHGYFSPLVTKLFALIERLLRRITTFSVVVGAATHRDLVDHRMITASESAIVLPGAKPGPRLDTQSARTMLELPSDAVVVGFVGRLTGIKRPDRFLRIATKTPRAHFVLFGDGPLRDEVAQQCEQLDNVSLRNFTSDLAMVFGVLDIVALTSDNEGVPLSLIEAAAAGLPTVAMNVGGVSEIVEHGVTGYLADSESELAEVITRLVDDADLRTSLGQQARLAINDRCSMQTYLQIHGALYERLVH